MTDSSGHEPRPAPGLLRQIVPDALRVGQLRRAAVEAASSLGLVNPLEALCGIDRVLPDDTYVVSYPRSGNTLTRYILAYLVRGTAETLEPEAVNESVPDPYVHPATVNAQSKGRLIKTHEPFLDACPRVIYVHRDYREVLVSYWHFIRRTERYAGTFSEFLRSGIPNRYGGWMGHIRAMWRRQEADPGTIHVIRYSDLVEHFTQTVASLAAFCGFGSDVDLLAVQRLTAIETVASGEQAYDGHFRRMSGQSFFVDRGKGAGWRENWSCDDLAWLAKDRETTAVMEKLGYL